MHVVEFLPCHFPVIHSSFPWPPFPKVILPIGLRALIVLNLFWRVIKDVKTNLLCCEFEEHLLDVPLQPLVLLSPHQVNVVGHDDEAVEPNTVIPNQEAQAVHDFFSDIKHQEILPVETSGCEKFDTVEHGSRIQLKVVGVKTADVRLS